MQRDEELKDVEDSKEKKTLKVSKIMKKMNTKSQSFLTPEQENRKKIILNQMGSWPLFQRVLFTSFYLDDYVLGKDRKDVNRYQLPNFPLPFLGIQPRFEYVKEVINGMTGGDSQTAYGHLIESEVRELFSYNATTFPQLLIADDFQYHEIDSVSCLKEPLMIKDCFREVYPKPKNDNIEFHENVVYYLEIKKSLEKPKNWSDTTEEFIHKTLFDFKNKIEKYFQPLIDLEKEYCQLQKKCVLFYNSSDSEEIREILAKTINKMKSLPSFDWFLTFKEKR